MSKLLDLRSIKRTQRIKEERKRKIFDSTLDKCYEYVKRESRFHTECIYRVPILLGNPLEYTKELVFYIYNGLINSGLRVDFLDYNKLRISWADGDIDYSKIESNNQTIGTPYQPRSNEGIRTFVPFVEDKDSIGLVRGLANDDFLPARKKRIPKSYDEFYR